MLNDKSYTLVVEVPMDSTAKKLNMSNEHLNLCIHYLIESGYLKGDFVFDTNKDSIKEVFILPPTINKCENALL